MCVSTVCVCVAVGKRVERHSLCPAFTSLDFKHPIGSQDCFSHYSTCDSHYTQHIAHYTHTHIRILHLINQHTHTVTHRAHMHGYTTQIYIYIYIYAFSRRFYPKRLTITFRLYIFISKCVPWESNPQPFALLTQCSTTEPHRNTQYIYIAYIHTRFIYNGTVSTFQGTLHTHPVIS